MEMKDFKHTYSPLPTEDIECTSTITVKPNTDVILYKAKSEHPIMDCVDNVCVTAGTVVGLGCLGLMVGVMGVVAGAMCLGFGSVLTVAAIPFSIRSSIREKKCVMHIVTVFGGGVTVRVGRKGVTCKNLLDELDGV